MGIEATSTAYAIAIVCGCLMQILYYLILGAHMNESVMNFLMKACSGKIIPAVQTCSLIDTLQYEYPQSIEDQLESSAVYRLLSDCVPQTRHPVWTHHL